MNNELIIIEEYCRLSGLENSFIDLLIEEGLVVPEKIEEEWYISSIQIREIERYSHLYYDLAINIEGIDAINHLLERLERMQEEVNELKRRVKFYEE